MIPPVPHETLVSRRAEAMAYAGLDEDAFHRLRRRYRRKVDIVEFILMWRDDAAAREIAERFDLCAESYVSAVRRGLGLPPRGPGGARVWSPAEDAELAALWDVPLSSGAIAARLNISRSAAMGRLKRLGLSPRPANPSGVGVMSGSVQDHGPKPELKWLPVGGLKVDPQYQRDTGSRRSRNLIDKIAGSFRWSRFGVVMAVRAAGSDSVWHVVDGQHRVEVARALKLPAVPVLVLPHATLAEAAADFVAINRDRVAVTPLHIHHAQLAAGEPEAQAIARVCARAKVEICRYPVPSDKMKPGQTLAVQSIARLIRLRGPDFAEKVLTALRTARGGVGRPAAAVPFVLEAVHEHA